jgi:VanZ family protein
LALIIKFLNRRSKRTLRLFCCALAVVLCLSLWLGGAQPFAVGLVPSPWDKVVHAAVFALLAAAMGVASGLQGWSMLATGFFGAVLAGAIDEGHQMFLPGREAGVKDFAADVIGAALGVLGLRWKSLAARAERRAE